MTTQYASPVCAPIDNRWGNREVCLCIHGFCGSPGFFLPLAEHIKAAHYDQFAPLLSGHGTRAKDLLTVQAGDWLADIDRAMAQLLEEYDKVHILGPSLGGVLATYAAGRYADSGKIGKVFLMVPGFQMRNKDFITRDYSNVGEAGFPLVQSADVPPELVESSYLYDFMYLKAIGELVRVGAIGEEWIARVTAPVWLLYTNADPVVDPERCAQAIKEFPQVVASHAYERSGHNLLIDCEREDVYRYIDAFLAAE